MLGVRVVAGSVRVCSAGFLAGSADVLPHRRIRTVRTEHGPVQDSAVGRYLVVAMHRPKLQQDVTSFDGAFSMTHHRVGAGKVVGHFELRPSLSNQMTPAQTCVAPGPGKAGQLR